MGLPHLRIRTLMIAVAAVAVLIVVVPPWWRYWFQSPWRLVTANQFRSADGRAYDGQTQAVFDFRRPGEASRMQKFIDDSRSQGREVQVERFTSYPRGAFPRATDDQVRRFDSPGR